VVAIIQPDTEQYPRFYWRKQLHHGGFAIRDLECVINVAGQIKTTAAWFLGCVTHIPFLSQVPDDPHTKAS
jgi:hypothetical protein